MVYADGTWGEKAKARSRTRTDDHNERYKRQDRRKLHARWNLYYAVRTGKITRPNVCEAAGCNRTGTRLQAHHDDYDKPLEVRWYCGSCHRLIHPGGLV